MRFKVDENLPLEVAELLRQHGHDAMTIVDQNMVGDMDSKSYPVLHLAKRRTGDRGQSIKRD